MPVLSLACHLPHNTPHIPSRYNNELTTKQTKAINNSYIYINISCKCDTNRAGHFTLDAYASRPVACCVHYVKLSEGIEYMKCLFGIVCLLSAYPFSFDDCYSICISYHFGNMNQYPSFRVRSWHNDTRCMSNYVIRSLLRPKSMIKTEFAISNN